MGAEFIDDEGSEDEEAALLDWAGFMLTDGEALDVVAGLKRSLIFGWVFLVGRGVLVLVLLLFFVEFVGSSSSPLEISIPIHVSRR